MMNYSLYLNFVKKEIFILIVKEEKNSYQKAEFNPSCISCWLDWRTATDKDTFTGELTCFILS